MTGYGKLARAELIERLWALEKRIAANDLQTLEHTSQRQRDQAALRDSEERFRLQYRDSPIPSYSWRRAIDDFILEDLNVCAN